MENKGGRVLCRGGRVRQSGIGLVLHAGSDEAWVEGAPDGRSSSESDKRRSKRGEGAAARVDEETRVERGAAGTETEEAEEAGG